VTPPLYSASLEETLLVLKVAFLVLLYLFIWRIVRAAARDVRSSQESMILSPQQAQSLGLVPSSRPSGPRGGQLIVITSSALEQGAAYELDATQLTIGRGANNDLALENDEFASARHARIEPRRDGVFVEDVGSTNGTFVNGIRLARERRLSPGDVVRVGETDLRFEEL
jgi:hypothetical protein